MSIGASVFNKACVGFVLNASLPSESYSYIVTKLCFTALRYFSCYFLCINRWVLKLSIYFYHFLSSCFSDWRKCQNRIWLRPMVATLMSLVFSSNVCCSFPSVCITYLSTRWVVLIERGSWVWKLVSQSAYTNSTTRTWKEHVLFTLTFWALMSIHRYLDRADNPSQLKLGDRTHWQSVTRLTLQSILNNCRTKKNCVLKYCIYCTDNYNCES